MKARTQPRIMLPPIPLEERERMEQRRRARAASAPPQPPLPLRQEAAPAPFTVTLEFTPKAHALLVAMAHEQDYATPKELILAELGTNVAAWMEGMSNHGNVAEWFIPGTQLKEEA